MKTSVIWTALAGALLAACLATPAHAETPVDQCTDSGSSPSTPSSTGAGFQPEPNHATRPAASAQINLGSVNPRTGAFAYSNDDISLGAGDSPSRLSLVRTYSSDQDGPNGVEVEPNAAWAAGQLPWYAFGRGGTHNLDVTFQVQEQGFGNQRYTVVAIRTGLETETFQLCLDGQYKNTRRNGSRLFADATYGAGGYRYELSDGSILLFEKMLPLAGAYACSMTGCGALRTWIAPNGDRTEFEYQRYFSYQDRRYENSCSSCTVSVPLFNTFIQECHPNFGGISECHSVLYPVYSTQGGFFPPVVPYPVDNQRLTRVSNSRGYELRFQYVDSTTNRGNPMYTVNIYLQRNRIQSVTGYWVSPLGQATQLGQVTYGYANCRGLNPDCLSSFQAADGSVTQYIWAGPALSIQLPGAASPATTVNFIKSPKNYYYPSRQRAAWPGYPPRLTREYYSVSTQTFADGTSVQYTPVFSNRWVAEPYAWAWLPYVSSMQITQPGGAVTTLNYVDQYDEHGGPVSVTDPLGRVTANTYNAVGALASTTLPEGQRIEYSYDARGNLLTTTRHPKPGSAETALTESHVYATGPTVDANACANQRLCNRPSSRTDARGFQTDYVWNSANGLLTSETRPADPSGLRPTISYTYGAFTGASSSSIQLVTSRTERIDATRILVTSYGYGSDIRLHSREVSRTDGSSTLRSCYNFDLVGNLISETQPGANLGSCP